MVYSFKLRSVLLQFNLILLLKGQSDTGWAALEYKYESLNSNKEQFSGSQVQLQTAIQAKTEIA